MTTTIYSKEITMRVQFCRYFCEDQEYIDEIVAKTPSMTVAEAATFQLVAELKEQGVDAHIDPQTFRPADGTYLLEGTVDQTRDTLQKAYDDGVAGDWQMIEA